MFRPNDQTDLDEQDERIRLREQDRDIMIMLEKAELLEQEKRKKVDSQPPEICLWCFKEFNPNMLIKLNHAKYCKNCYSKAVMESLESRYLNNGDG